jgi:ATP-dependent HslUV protease ATP-binding subunit HslU
MIHYLPDRLDGQNLSPEEMTPRQMVAELDRHIVGQDAAKRAVAVALRNRQRRRKLPPDLAADVLPKNIILIGPTGVGKTEIARRISRLTASPFLKVEASRFTEVGYVGRDVESRIRDLVEIAVDLVRQEKRAAVRAQAEQNVQERLLHLLVPAPPRGTTGFSTARATAPAEAGPEADEGPAESAARTREKFRRDLEAGLLEDRVVEIEVESSASPTLQIFGNQGLEDMGMNLKEMIPGMFGRKTRRRSMKISEARKYLSREEADKLVDEDRVTVEAVARAEESGIIFVDEIDKVAGRETGHGPDVSREGVQRDLLPIIEGTVVKTKYGMVRTDYILFIAAGAFNVAKPSDLIPELQGRFPVRVELAALTRDDLVRILTEPANSLLKQYTALIATDGVTLRFADDAVLPIADFAVQVNRHTEDIGARRLHTLLERLLEEISFEAPERPGTEFKVDAAYVERTLKGLVEDHDLSRYVL